MRSCPIDCPQVAARVHAAALRAEVQDPALRRAMLHSGLSAVQAVDHVAEGESLVLEAPAVPWEGAARRFNALAARNAVAHAVHAGRAHPA